MYVRNSTWHKVNTQKKYYFLKGTVFATEDMLSKKLFKE